MACYNGELDGAVGQNKRRRSDASRLWGRKCSPLEESKVALSFESTMLALPKLDSFAFIPPCFQIERPDYAEEEQDERKRAEVSGPSATKEEGVQADGGSISDICHDSVPSLERGNYNGEGGVTNFGEVIPGACDALVDIAFKLVAELDGLTFKAPVNCVYNPLVYARNLHVQYIRKHGGRRVEVLLVGMNPGPFGMAQTGVPFGDSKYVRTFHGLSGEVNSPKVVHPNRPVLGLDCRRSEVSGQRLWGWAQDRFGCATAFFKRFWVYNYCPLVFMEASGKNRTPDKLNPFERAKLELVCNEALIKTVSILRPTFVVGVGKYAAVKIQACNIAGVKVGDIMHPSPANPQANKDWGKKVEEQLLKLGIVLDN